jgi:hypothetical protein
MIVFTRLQGSVACQYTLTKGFCKITHTLTELPTDDVMIISICA